MFSTPQVFVGLDPFDTGDHCYW